MYVRSFSFKNNIYTLAKKKQTICTKIYEIEEKKNSIFLINYIP
jgi:hypothetical protein